MLRTNKIFLLVKPTLQLISTPFPSIFRVILYRLMGANIMDGATIRAFSIVIVKNLIMEPKARIRPFAVIVYPKKLHLKAYSGISFFTLIHGTASLTIGVHSQISVFVFIDLHDNVSFGNWSGPAPFCKIMTHGVYWPASWGYTTKYAPVEIGDFVWIHFNCKIGPGAKIPSNNVIISGSTIVSEIRQNGNIIYDNSIKKTRFPITLMRNILDDEQIDNFLIDSIKEWAKEKYKNCKLEILEKENSIILQIERKPFLVIHIREGSNRIDKKIPHWLWGYKLSDSDFESHNGTLDFYRILCSDNPSTLFKSAISFLRKRYGIRAGEFKHREYCEITPPLINVK